MTTPHAAAASSARQRLASVLGTLQQNPDVPPAVLDILSGLARAMGPLFQLERGSTDLSLFQTARQVLQETLEKIQVADQSFPGVAEATEAVAGTLGVIFKAMREAGIVPGQPQAAQQPAPQQPQQQPFAQPQPQPFAQPQQQPFAQPQPAPNPMPLVSHPQQPFALQSAQPAPVQQQPIPLQPAPQPLAPQQPPFARPVQPQPSAQPQPARPAGSTGKVSAIGGSVPMGPNGLPRLESEIGVHSETNFYTDFLGDIRNNGGIFVATFHVLPIGGECEVALTFPGNLTTEFRGVVRWKREAAPGASIQASPGLGIEITNADAAAWDLITRFIRKREPIMHEM